MVRLTVASPMPVPETSPVMQASEQGKNAVLMLGRNALAVVAHAENLY
jgi:hypothetical protein